MEKFHAFCLKPSLSRAGLGSLLPFTSCSNVSTYILKLILLPEIAREKEVAQAVCCMGPNAHSKRGKDGVSEKELEGSGMCPYCLTLAASPGKQVLHLLSFTSQDSRPGLPGSSPPP
jgi:hypothetical protein